MTEAYSTKNRLAVAIKDLLSQRSMSEISVIDIVDRAKISRKSFYYHFRDKFDLVNWVFEQEYTALLKKIRRNADAWEFLAQACSLFYQDRHFYHHAFEVEGQNSFSDFFSESMEPIILDKVSTLIALSENRDFYVKFYCDAMLAAVRRWLAEGSNIEPTQFVAMLRQAVNPENTVQSRFSV